MKLKLKALAVAHFLRIDGVYVQLLLSFIPSIT